MQFEAQARAQEQLEQAKGTFSPEEAQIFTQSGNIVVRLIGLKFRSGSADLPADSGPLMQKLATVIQIYPDSTLMVEGHTDSQGSASGNQALSQARADAVLNELVGNYRVGALRISAIGYGETRPVAINETKAGRERNRRIDLLITPAPLPTEF
jgi:outer membrane protein OmpA-like peptidoglycan-associated protein